MKKQVWVALLAGLLVLALTACAGIKPEQLSGVWHTSMQDTPEQARALLENMDAYEEEIALAELDSLLYVKELRFGEDGSYSYRIDVEGTRAFVRSFYDGYFAALFENREALNEVYGQSFETMEEAEFRQFYAQLYGSGSYEALLDTLVENAYNYDTLEEPSETGTFVISGTLIACTPTAETAAAGMEAEFLDEEGKQLKLIYANGEEVYTRVG